MRYRKRFILGISLLSFVLGFAVPHGDSPPMFERGLEAASMSSEAPAPVVYPVEWLHGVGEGALHTLVYSNGTRITLTAYEYEGYRETGLLPLQQID